MNNLKVVRAFTDNDLGGNPAGVVLDADNLSNDQKQSIAQNAGFPETAFISESKIGDFKIDFFTPNKQIPHCGHATVASFTLLHQTGRIGDGDYIKESIEGPRNVQVLNGEVFLEQSKPTIEKLDITNDFVKSLLFSVGITVEQIINGLVFRASVGVPFVIFGIKDPEILAGLNPDMKKLAEASAELSVIGVYLFTLKTKALDRHASTRMFAPLYGIPEEAATGMGAGALAPVLRNHFDFNQTDFLIEQGHFIRPKSPSLLKVRLQLNPQNEIELVRTGGKASLII